MSEAIVWEAWSSEDGSQVTLVPRDEVERMQSAGILGEAPHLLYSIAASNFDEAMAEHHQRAGLEPYLPPAKQ